MITAHDFYTVMTAMVPLYVAMILAYGSVRWWNIFSPDQCSGINRFVAIFAVPLLSFHFISLNNPYEMNFRFIAADTLQKIIVLVVVGIWAGVAKNGSLDWLITLFSVSTLPNTLVMGIPLLIAMYGDYSGQLMVQVVVMQCIIWYTILLFLFEYRGAKILIKDQFPETAGSIASFKVEYDVVSLDGHDFLETEAEIGDDGKLHVTVRKSNVSRSPQRLAGLTPRPSNLTGMEIYSLSSSRNPTPRGSSFNHSDFYSMMGSGHTRPSSFDESTTNPGFRSNLTPNPETTASGFESYPNPNPETTASGFRSYPAPNQKFITSGFGSYPDPNLEVTSTITKTMTSVQQNELQMFIWSSSGSPVSEGGGIHVYGGDFESVNENSSQPGISSGLTGDAKLRRDGLGSRSGRGGGEEKEKEKEMKLDAGKQMPPASVMGRLILIMVWRKLIRNPNTYSSLIGLIWSLVSFRWHVPMPKIIEKSISILSDAGLGMAMFSLGLFMALQPKLIACGNSVAAFSMAVRFLTGPAVMATASIIVGLRGTLLRVAIVQAALPQGIVPFVFAKEYNVHPTILSTGVVFGMLIALPITLVYYILLGL